MDWIPPMEPVVSTKLVKKEGWIHQIKWDGIRGLSYIDHGQLKLFTKKGFERTAYYPELQELIKLFKGTSGILDGELIVFDDTDNPSFYRSLIRERIRTESKILHHARKAHVKYIVFDILNFNGIDIRQNDLMSRKELLMKNLTKSGNITITDDFNDGESLYQLMKTKGWEGIVSKNMNSSYVAGKKHTAWYKTKISKKLLAVVGGIQWKNNFPNALLFGIYQEDSLYYIGKASLGLKQKDFMLLKEYSKELTSINSPFKDVTKLQDVTWIKPSLTCWISFLEWTSSGHLRHPKILGFHGHLPQDANGKEFTE